MISGSASGSGERTCRKCTLAPSIVGGELRELVEPRLVLAPVVARCASTRPAPSGSRAARRGSSRRPGSSLGQRVRARRSRRSSSSAWGISILKLWIVSDVWMVASDICILLGPQCGSGSAARLPAAWVSCHHPDPGFTLGDLRRSRPVELFLHGDELEPEAPQSVEEALELALVEGLGQEPGPTFAGVASSPPETPSRIAR